MLTSVSNVHDFLAKAKGCAPGSDCRWEVVTDDIMDGFVDRWESITLGKGELLLSC